MDRFDPDGPATARDRPGPRGTRPPAPGATGVASACRGAAPAGAVTAPGWRPVITVTLWQVAASLCYYSLFAATAYFRDTFEISRTAVGVLVTAAMLGYTLNLFPSGAAVDGFGEKRVMLAGLVGLAAMAGLVGLAPSYGFLLVAAFALGACYASAMPASNRGIVTSAPAGRAGLAMGLKQIGVTLGSALAALVVAGVAAVALWRWGFAAIAALGLLYALVFRATYLGSGGHGRWERPNLARLRGNSAYVLLVFAGVFIGAGVFTTVGYTLLYANEAAGLSAAIAGIVLAGVQTTGSLGRLGAGIAVDRLASRHGAATVTVVLTAVASLLYAALALGPATPALAVGLLLGVGLTTLGGTGVYYSCLTEMVSPAEVGAATAGGQTAINVGGMLAPPAFGYLADTAGYGAGWALLGVCGLAATGLVLAVRAAHR